MSSAAGPVLAIDFGTTSTRAVLSDGGRVRQLREPASDGWSWPSSVFLDEGVPLVGTAAEHRKRLAPAAYRDELKRHLGEEVPLDLGGRGYRPGLLVTLLLQSVRQEAERVNGAPVGRNVLTCPASWGPADPRREELLAAAGRAGIASPDLVPEPVAAALAPVAGDPLPPGSTVLVYDFGGGTFDAALVRLGGGGAGEEAEHTVLGCAALDDCGGRDLDAALAARLRANGGAALRALLEREGDAGPRARLELTGFARTLKHRLGAEVSASDVFPGSGLVVGLDRQELLSLARPLLVRTTDCCARLLRRAADEARTAGAEPPSVDAVILVGGSCELPGLPEHLAATLRLPLRRPEDPRTAVSQGAAAWASGGPVLTVAATGPLPDRTPLSWPLPPGPATLLEWRVGPGAAYAAGEVLARVRAADGSLLDLTAPRPGTLRAQHARPGAQVAGGDWLVTVSALPSRP
ncbi:Hsp70 family protein [Streptomyces sp. DSM 44917]|uniref:Hsp70 family protein n=1 Tax=Streptomyces boetiae TaxID=3075541 RepID=A0ABU2L8W7_9ACTN|nr:Hsp70 family protein [Streptomyces sp. DSM 44917]MDT0308020.1 Hsp70 family protein [Streptomyces sp. DSM 44917]